jgi:hypothetical protein
MAMDPTDHAITPALPEPPAAPQPSLFAEIHASQHPTTNLEHLSKALDELSLEDELEDLPRTVPEPPDPEPALPIQHETRPEATYSPGRTDSLPPPEAPSAPSRRPLILLAILAVLAVIGGLWFGISRLKRPHPGAPAAPPVAKATPAPKPPPSSPVVAKPAPLPEPVKQPEVAAPLPVPPSPPAPKPGPPSVPSKAERLETIIQGDLNKAVAQGSRQAKAIPDRWTLRLEIACQGLTIQNAAELLKGQDPDLFLVPMAMRDGRTCYQVFLGSFGSEAAAREAARKLPAPFLAEGNRPKPYRVSQIPDRQ